MPSTYVTYTVGYGDTIQSIGSKYDVNWVDIVELNGLRYPYINTDIQENDDQFNDTVAKLGTTLLIPTEGLIVPNKYNALTYEIEEYAYGNDLDLFNNLLTPNGTSNLEDPGMLSAVNGDLHVARGLENLRQQLILRLGTPKGTLLLHPEFGSNLTRYVGRRVSRELLVDIRLEVQECLLGDSRVEGLGEINVEFANKAIHIDLDVYPVEPANSPFRIDYRYSWVGDE